MNHRIYVTSTTGCLFDKLDHPDPPNPNAKNLYKTNSSGNQVYLSNNNTELENHPKNSHTSRIA